MSYDGYKFSNLNDLLLYSIARNRKPMDIKDLYNLHSESGETNIYRTLKKLEAQKLIKNYGKWKREGRKYGLNERRLPQIKKILGEHWESDWEVDWKNVAKG